MFLQVFEKDYIRNNVMILKYTLHVNTYPNIFAIYKYTFKWKEKQIHWLFSLMQILWLRIKVTFMLLRTEREKTNMTCYIMFTVW